MRKICTVMLQASLFLTSVLPALTWAQENKILECVVVESNGKIGAYKKDETFTIPLTAFSASNNGEDLIFKNDRREERLVVSRKTGEFNYTMGHWSREERLNNEATMKGTCSLKAEKLKF